jgi:SAM-dependent methyltransferase
MNQERGASRAEGIEPGTVDRMLRGLARRIGAAPAPVATALKPARARALQATLEQYRPRAEPLAARLARGDAGARRALAGLADQAFADLRARVVAEARADGLVAGALAAGDARFGDCTDGEYLDDPALDADVRRRLMADLDALNDLIESYDRFLDQLVPFAAAGRPTRVLDLAAGHGGFAIAATAAARARGLDLRFTATDLQPEYLEMGRAEAERAGVAVDFAVQDALDLSSVPAGAHDVITCTQSLHHFPPGLIAVMFEQAARAAGRAVVFIDGCRSLMNGVTLYAVGRVRYRNPAFAHDAWVSSRRFFVPEELELLARLGPWGEGVEARWLPPGFCLLRLARDPGGRPAH